MSQMSLWRQVKIRLDADKHVDGGFRSEESIPPDTMMYFPWGTTNQTNGKSATARSNFQALLDTQPILQFGGQESLGRGFVEHWSSEHNLVAQTPARQSVPKIATPNRATIAWETAEDDIESPI